MEVAHLRLFIIIYYFYADGANNPKLYALNKKRWNREVGSK